LRERVAEQCPSAATLKKDCPSDTWWGHSEEIDCCNRPLGGFSGECSVWQSLYNYNPTAVYPAFPGCTGRCVGGCGTYQWARLSDGTGIVTRVALAHGCCTVGIPPLNAWGRLSACCANDELCDTKNNQKLPYDPGDCSENWWAAVHEPERREFVQACCSFYKANQVVAERTYRGISVDKEATKSFRDSCALIPDEEVPEDFRLTTGNCTYGISTQISSSYFLGLSG